MEETYTPIEFDQAPVERPKFLKVLCILSFVSIGVSILNGLLGMVKGPASSDEMLERKVELTKSVNEMNDLGMDGLADMLAKIERMSMSVNDAYYSVTFVALITALIGIYGVWNMWNGKKLGFHLYIIYSLLAVLQLYFFVSPNDIPTIIVVWNILISGGFIYMYSRNLNWLK
jgi:hypothetical protein